MDPDLVRLILIVLGVLLVAGIYLWDRYKRSQPRAQAFRRPPAGMSIDGGEAEDEAPLGRAEPHMDDDIESIPEMRLDEGQQPGHAVAPPPKRPHPRDMLDPDPEDIGEWAGAARLWHLLGAGHSPGAPRSPDPNGLHCGEQPDQP